VTNSDLTWLHLFQLLQLCHQLLLLVPRAHPAESESQLGQPVLEHQGGDQLDEVLLHGLEGVVPDHCAVVADASPIEDAYELLQLREGCLCQLKLDCLFSLSEPLLLEVSALAVADKRNLEFVLNFFYLVEVVMVFVLEDNLVVVLNVEVLEVLGDHLQRVVLLNHLVSYLREQLQLPIIEVL